MLRNIIAVVVGLVLGGIVNMAIIQASVVMHPMPEGADMQDPEALKEWIGGLPLSGFLMALLAHQAGALVGGFVASLIAKRKFLVGGIIIGAFFLLGGTMMVVQYPSPVWFAITDLALYVPMGILGAIAGGIVITPKTVQTVAAE